MPELHPFEFRLLNYLNQNLCSIFSSPFFILTLVSGGRDSMSLLHALLKVQKSSLWKHHKFDIIVVHFNHEKRIPDAYEDAYFVEEFCKIHNISFFLYKFSDEPLELQKKFTEENFQNEARTWRKTRSLELYSRLLASGAYDNGVIATAHHARDHVESVLLHMVRGCGMGGLEGLLKLQHPWIHPLIEESYEQIVAYSKDSCLCWREDSTNFETTYVRNLLRHKVLPVLEAINPQYEKAFLNLSKNISRNMSIPRKQEIGIFPTPTEDEIYHFIQPYLSEVTQSVVKNILVHVAKAQKQYKATQKTPLRIVLSKKYILIISGFVMRIVACESDNNL